MCEMVLFTVFENTLVHIVTGDFDQNRETTL